MRVAYADPPYLGLAAKFYGDPTYDSLAEHHRLIERMDAEYDAWAYSLTSTTLRQVLPLCPEDVRVMAWVKPFASFKPGVRVAYAWEPVIVKGGRNEANGYNTVRDWVACNIALRRGLRGAKPEGFCYWLFEVLGMEPDDEFHDLFPGTGGVTAAWEQWRQWRQVAMF